MGMRKNLNEEKAQVLRQCDRRTERKDINIEPSDNDSLHYENPLHLSSSEYEWDGKRKMIDFLSSIGKVLFERYKGKVKYWLTLMRRATLTVTFWVYCRKCWT